MTGKTAGRQHGRTASSLWKQLLLTNIFCWTASLHTAESFSILYSTSEDRSSPLKLEGATLFGDVFILLDTTGENVGLIDRVVFDLLGSGSQLTQTEKFSPYDFRGGSSSSAYRWNTATVAPNIFGYTLKVDVFFEDSSVQQLEAHFHIDQVEVEYYLAKSNDPSRSLSQSLDGASLSGLQYIFLTPETSVESVQFDLDDGSFVKTENYAPYDFRGGSKSAANPWNADLYEPGSVHVIRTTISRGAGLEPLVFDTTFSINFPTHNPSAAPSDPPNVSANPSIFPSIELSVGASNSPSVSFVPSPAPSDSPSVSGEPSPAPSGSPSVSSSDFPSKSVNPSMVPSSESSADPSDSPINVPVNPSMFPSIEPSVSGSLSAPSVTPSSFPTPPIVPEEECYQISYLPCQNIRISGNYSIDFVSQSADTIQDKNGIGTGFSMVDPASQNAGPIVEVPGYDPSRLTVDTSQGKLYIQATNGLQIRNTNTLLNALGVGLNLPSKLITIETTMDVPPEAVGGWSQQGLWFGAATNFGRGTSEDEYCKMILGSKSAGVFLVQLLCEIDGDVNGESTVMGIFSDPLPPTIRLRMEMNPVDKEVTGFYQFDTGIFKIGPITGLPDEFFSYDQAGLDPTVKTRSMGGIFASNRYSNVEQTFAFNSFDLREYPLPPPRRGDVPPPDSDFDYEFDRWSFEPSGGAKLPTGLAFGPDGRLYVLDIFGIITAVTLDYDSKAVVNQEIITTLQDNESGESRLSLGIAIDPNSTPSNVILWVGHSDGSVNAGAVNSGKITRISNYPALDVADDIIWDLPRAFANHALNDIEFGPDHKLYLAFGGSTGAGAPNTSPSEFADRPEQPLTAAVLVADVFNPAFGGDCGTPLYEFGIPANCSVEVYASGLRNSYDLTWHYNGELYATDNGLGVTGTVPQNTTAPCTGLADLVMNPGKQPDLLQRLEQGFYYGHPNPYRNECVFKDGEFQSLANGEVVLPESNYKAPMFVLGESLSANGIITYLSDKFFSKLMGDLFIVNYSAGDTMTRTVLSDDGLQVVAHGVFQSDFADPLPIEQDPKGRIYVGEFGDNKVTILDPLPLSPEPIGNWTSLGPAPEFLLDPASATVKDKLYMVGGKTSSGHTLDAYVYDPFGDTWSAIPSLPFADAVENAAAVSFNDRLYVFGGSTGPFSGARNYAAYYDPASSTWTMVSSPMPTARGGPTAQVLDNRIYVMGGMDDSGASVDTVEIFDPTTETWTTGPSLQTRRDNPGSAVLNGKIYVVGGRTRQSNGSSITHATVEVLASLSSSNSTTEWSYVASMPTARRTMTVGTISGRLQVIGGESPVVSVNEEYNPETDTWRDLMDIEVGRHGAAGGTIRGKIYVACGGPTGGTSFTDQVEVFGY